MKTEEEIERQIDLARQSEVDHQGTQWKGMTYEQGVQNALNWVIENEDIPPMEEE